MPLKFQSTGGGTVTLDVPSTSSTVTLTIPANTGNLVIADTSGNANISGNLTITGTMTAANSNVTGTVVMSSSFKRNRIINGNMLIDQRNAGANVSVGTATSTYTLDRWRVYHDTAITSNITAQQSTTVPTTGYINSQILTNGTAATAAAADSNIIQQRIEGLNVTDLNFGSSTAATVTLSFWIRSSLTGTFGVTLSNSAQNRSYVSTYTINSANTWEQKTVTVAGDQSGTWLTTSGIGLIVSWDLGSGTSLNTTAGAWQAGQYFRTSACTSFIGTTGATFYITGVQLEVGTKATPYEMQIYSDQLAQCQRYYERTGQGAGGAAYSTTYANMFFMYNVTKRTNPVMSLTTTSPVVDQWGVGSKTASGATITGSALGLNGAYIQINGFTGFTAGTGLNLATDQCIALSAEL
jgi:hypothetical protein